MKKYITILACAASLAAAVSCQKELTGNENVDNGTVITLYVNDDAECRSAFNGVDKIALTGTENFNVFYVGSDGKTAGNLKATPAGAGAYTFTVPGSITPGDYSWYAVSPYSPALQYWDEKNPPADYNVALRLTPVQLPGANTFDANCDFLISDSFTVSEGSATINKFKRIAAPLLLNVNGLDAEDKIYAATLTLSAAASGTGLTGSIKTKFSHDFAEAGMVDMVYEGNGVSAIYPEGLEAISSNWPVWFMVNPYALTEGVQMTVKITTATKTYERTVTLPSTKELATSSISRINYNAKGTGVEEKNTIFQCFTEKSVADLVSASKTPSLTASDGKAYTWTFTRTQCTMKASEVKEGMPYGMQLSAETGTKKHLEIPSFGDKNVLSVSLYMHPATYGSATGKYCVSADSLSAEIAPAVKMSNATLGNQGGVSFFALPAGMETIAGSWLKPSGTVNIAAALFEVSTIAYDSNDYYDMFTKGIDFKIGNQIINSTNYPKSKLVTADDITLASLNDYANGVIFIDNSTAVTVSTSSSLTFKSGTVIIGRYKNRTQPVLKQTSTGSAYFRPNSNYFKNIRFESTSAGHFVSAGVSSGSVCSFICEDCTIICSKNLLREASSDRKFGDVVFNNCVIETASTTGLIAASASKTGTPGGDTVLGTENKIEFNNCVVSTKSSDGTSMNAVASNILDFSATKASATPVAIVLTGNTFVGFGGASSGTALVNAKTIGSFNINGNVFHGNWPTSDKATNRVIKTSTEQDTKPDPRSISNNYGMMNGAKALGETNGDSQKRWNSDDHTVALSFTKTGNLWSSTSSPFTSADYANLYFPVDKTVVTNGAGATYDTKLWKNWTEEPTKASHEGFSPVE